MTRIKINARRIFSLLIPFFFFTSVHAEQTAAPAKPVTVEAKNETFAPQHPDQYLSWKATSEQSERVDALAEDPRLVILWAGYPFSRDYNKPRGHAFAVTDVRETLRTGAPKNAEDGPLPMACWSCKSPDVARLIQKDGEDGYFHGKWARGGPEIVNNLGCADCHNTASPEFAKGKPELTLSRPYAARAMEAIGKPFEKAGRFDQQSMVCGQCHVEYYFDGKNKAVKFPWDDGMKVENMEQYYDKIAFSDWTNSLSKTPMLKAQLQALQDKIRANPQNSEQWALLGEYYLWQNDYSNSLLAYRQALQLRGENAELYAALATVLYYQASQHMTALTRAMIDKALALDSNEITALMLLASDAFMQANYAQAIELWQKVMDLNSPRINRTQLVESINMAKLLQRRSD